VVRKISLITLALVLLLSLSACTPRPVITTARVIEVIDGDTIIIERGIHVRYIGIDTPELHPQAEPFAIEAYQANRALVEGKLIRLEKDVSETDRYGRLLRYIYIDDTFVNAELVRLGFAVAKAYPPDTKYQVIFERMAAEARAAKRGIWVK
jgi:micrococcal nuclease